MEHKQFRNELYRLYECETCHERGPSYEHTKPVVYAYCSGCEENRWFKRVAVVYDTPF